jgi:hypothetical protein
MASRPTRTAVTFVKCDPRIVTQVPTGPACGAKDPICGAGVATGIVKSWFERFPPPGVVTPIGPVSAPEGTVAVIWVEESIENDAEIPAKVTSVVPEKFVPVMTTDVPAAPDVGENDEMCGAGGRTVKLLEDVPGPSAFVIETGPVVAPDGTSAVIWMSESTLKDDAEMPLNWTSNVPVKSDPEIVTDVPTWPESGVNDEIVGAAA